MIAVSVVLNMHVLAVINHGIGHLLESVKQTNILKCSTTLPEACITTNAIIDNTKWICSTCQSNLSNEKLPVCSKANKMGLPMKQQCLN